MVDDDDADADDADDADEDGVCILNGIKVFRIVSFHVIINLSCFCKVF
jgi:hypothetical protein